METAEEYVERFTKSLDVILGVMGFGLGLLIISLYYIINLKQQDIGLAILSSCLIYVLFRKKFRAEEAISSRKGRFKSILNILFYLVFLICIFIYSVNLYYRPVSYFMLICILAAIISSQILYVREGDGVTSLLLQIFLLSVLIRVGIFYNFPSLMGYDAYFHASMARVITDTGFVAPIETSGKYFYYPLSHILISLTQIMGKTDIKDAVFYSIGLASVLSTVGIYLVGKKLEGPQMGLLATLLINLNNHNIVAGIANITPGSLVLCYFIFIIYAMFSEKQSLRYTGLILVTTILMVLTHQLTTFVVFLSLLSICVGKYLHSHVYKNLFTRTNSFNYILFFMISLQTYWMFTYVDLNTSFLEMVLSPLMDVLHIGTSYSSQDLILGSGNNTETLETLLLHISYLTLPFFAIGGVLAWTSSGDIKKINKFSITLVVAVLYGLAYGIPLLGIRNFLTSRWFPLIAVFLVLVAASYMLKLVNLFNSKKAKISAIFIIVLLFSFIMITTPGINKDNPLVAKDTTVRNQFKSIEIEAIKTVTAKHSGNILMDSPYDSCLFYRDIRYDSSNATYFNVQHIQTGDIDGNPVVLLRKSTVKEPVSINDPERYGVNLIQALPEGFFNRFEAYDYARIYDNEEVFAYIKEERMIRN